MNVYVRPTDAEIVACPYIDGKKFTQKYSVLKDLSLGEFEMLLTNGWRHFGYFFFTPNCLNCNSCTPIRTDIKRFNPSKSQRRNLRKNTDKVCVEFVPLKYSDELYEVYKKHSKVKFSQETSRKDFKESFFSDAISGNSIISLYRLDSKLIGVGFIDLSEDGLSSVYFCYDTDYSSLGLGVFSILKEIEYGRSLNKSYYYLGYYIEGNGSMEYKSRYTPSEILDWTQAKWVTFR